MPKKKSTTQKIAKKKVHKTSRPTMATGQAGKAAAALARRQKQLQNI
jgi:hypothetical protein